MGRSRAELVQDLIALVEQVPPDEPEAGTLLGCLYTADPRLAAKLAFLEAYDSTGGDSKLAGDTLEQVAWLAFGGVGDQQPPRRDSFRSTGPQYDVLVHGDSPAWITAMRLLGLQLGRTDVLVECKAERENLNDQTVCRLCALIEGGLAATIGLGVFFSLRPPTGIHASQTHVTASAARLRQLLFLAQRQIPIVVLDLVDLRELTRSGTLLLIIRNRIRELAEISARPPVRLDDPQACALPSHLAELL